MAITGTSTDYTGRLRDINISQNVKPLVTGAQPVAYNFGKISSYIAGVEKLVQRYLIALFNTGLADQLRASKNNGIQEALHVFNLLNWEVIQAFRAYQKSNPGMPEDEQLAGAELQNLTVTGDNIYIKIQLATQAGEDVVYLLPIPLQ